MAQNARKSRMAQYDGFQYSKGCVGKKGYPSRRIALGVLRSIPDKDPALGVYRCKFCGRHHLGKDRYKEHGGA